MTEDERKKLAADLGYAAPGQPWERYEQRVAEAYCAWQKLTGRTDITKDEFKILTEFNLIANHEPNNYGTGTTGRRTT